MPEKPVIALFDFDGTLTVTDSFLPFLRHVAGRRAFWLGLFALSPVLATHALGLRSSTRTKQLFVRHFLRGRSNTDLRWAAEDFCLTRLTRIMSPLAMERLLWHQQQGHRVIVLSASLDTYLVPWAERLGINEVLATRIASSNEICTGELDGANCRGEEKVRRLTEHLGRVSEFEIEAYVDDGSDRYVLDVVSRGHYRAFGSGLRDRVAAWKTLLSALW